MDSFCQLYGQEKCKTRFVRSSSLNMQIQISFGCSAEYGMDSNLNAYDRVSLFRINSNGIRGGGGGGEEAI